jgi:flagellin
MRIGTNVSSLIAHRVRQRNNGSTKGGLRISRDSDAPAELGENRRAQKAGIASAIDNADRAANLIAAAEGGLDQVASLLTELQLLVSQPANSGAPSSDQFQVDAILDTINRIAQTVSFDGVKLLDGSFDYTAIGASGADRHSIGIASVSTASLGDSASGSLSSLGSGGANALGAGDMTAAQKVVESAIRQVSELCDRLAAFHQGTIVPTISSLSVAYENASASESAIGDADFAEQTARITRAQILAHAATR